MLHFYLISFSTLLTLCCLFHFAETLQEEKTDKMVVEESDKVPPEENYSTSSSESYHLLDIGTVLLKEEKV